MRFRLRTLLIAAGVLPPLIAGAWWAARTGEIRTIERGIGEFSEFLLSLAPALVAIAAVAYVLSRCAAAFTKR